MRAPRIGLAGLFTLIAAATGDGQVTVPIRTLGPAEASSPAIFKAISGVRLLSDGRVLVNDGAGRQVVMLDPTLQHATVVIDSAAGRNTSYGAAGGGLLGYLADSSLFVDAASQAFVVLDPAGKVGRVMPVTGRNSTPALTSQTGAYGYPGFSAAFGVVFEAPPGPGSPRRPAPGEPDILYLARDTDAVVRYDLLMRKMDTLGPITTGRGTLERITSSGLKAEPRSNLGPLVAVGDGWGLMSDGSVAIVRGRDYRIDWINADGTRTSSPRVAHDWRQFSDADKVHFADSLNLQLDSTDSAARARWRADSIARATGKGDSVNAERVKAMATTVARMGATGLEAEFLMRAAGTPPSRPPNPQVRLQASEIPDYLPALDIANGRVRGDGDNNLWVRVRQVAGTDGVVYDIVNRQGVLIDRVRIPSGKSIVGFGSGGVIFLTSSDAGVVRLERARWK